MTPTSRVVVHCTFCDLPYNYDKPEVIPTNARIYCIECKKQFRFKRQLSTSQTNQKENVIQKVHDQKPAIFDTSKIIDDPDELLMSVAMRELNKPNPDPRWANVLITTRRENIGYSKKEGKIRSQFKSMNIKNIAKILYTKPKDISQQQDLEESSSL